MHALRRFPKARGSSRKLLGKIEIQSFGTKASSSAVGRCHSNVLNTVSRLEMGFVPWRSLETESFDLTLSVENHSVDTGLLASSDRWA